MTTECKCGCGKPVDGSHNRKFATAECSRLWHNANRRKGGYPPIIKRRTNTSGIREIAAYLMRIGEMQREGAI